MHTVDTNIEIFNATASRGNEKVYCNGILDLSEYGDFIGLTEIKVFPYKYGGSYNLYGYYEENGVEKTRTIPLTNGHFIIKRSEYTKVRFYSYAYKQYGSDPNSVAYFTIKSITARDPFEIAYGMFKFNEDVFVEDYNFFEGRSNGSDSSHYEANVPKNAYKFFDALGENEIKNPLVFKAGYFYKIQKAPSSSLYTNVPALIKKKLAVAVSLNCDTVRSVKSERGKLVKDEEKSSGIEFKNGLFTSSFSTGGSLTEDFEGTSFDTKFKWTSNYITDGFTKRTDYKHSGTSSGYMGTSSHSRTCYSETKVKGSKVSFYYLVSSEKTYDKFNFYINGTNKLTDSGTTMTTMKYMEFALDPTKESTIKFEYKTDSSGYTGKYGFFIDDLTVTNKVFVDKATFVSKPVASSLFTKNTIKLNLVDYTAVGDVTYKTYYSLDNGATYTEFTEVDKSELNDSAIFKVEFTKLSEEASVSFKALEVISESSGPIELSLNFDLTRTTCVSVMENYVTRRTLRRSENLISDTLRAVNAIVDVKTNLDTKRSISVATIIQAKTKRAVGVSKAIEFETLRTTRLKANTQAITVRRVSKLEQLFIDTNRKKLSDFSLMFDTNRKPTINSSLTFDTDRNIERMIVNRLNVTVKASNILYKRELHFGFGYKLYKANMTLTHNNCDVILKKFDAKTGSFIEIIPYTNTVNGENGKYAYSLRVICKEGQSFTLTANSIYADTKIEAINYNVPVNSDETYIKINNNKARVVQAISDTWTAAPKVKLNLNEADVKYPIVLRSTQSFYLRHSGMTAAEGSQYAFVAYSDCNNDAKVVRIVADTRRKRTHQASLKLNFDTLRVKGIPTSITANTIRRSQANESLIADTIRLTTLNTNTAYNTNRRISNSTSLSSKTNRSTTLNASTINDLRRELVTAITSTYDTKATKVINILQTSRTLRRISIKEILTSATKRLTVTAIKLAKDTTRVIYKCIRLLSDTQRAITENEKMPVKITADTSRTSYRTLEAKFDTNRFITKTPTYVVSLTASTKRTVLSNIRTVTDTKRVTVVPANISSDTKKRTCGTVKLIADVARGTIIFYSVNTDTKRATSINYTTSFDTERVYGIGVNTCFNASRTIHIAQKVTANAIRAIKVVESSVFDLERKLAIQHIASSDTMRTLVTGVSVDITADTIRIISNALIISSDTKRKVAGRRIEINYDLAREVIAPVDLIADTSRLTQNLVTTNFNTHRTPMCLAQEIKQVFEIELTDTGTALIETSRTLKNSLDFELTAFEPTFEVEFE